MTCVVDVTTFKKQNGGRSPIEINNYISATRIPYFTKYFTWMFIRMCTIVTSSDMTSFVYIGDEKHHVKMAWKGKK